MACRHVNIGGIPAIVCGSRPRRKWCKTPACDRAASLLCDWRTGPDGKTCDAPICTYCAKEVAPDKHPCPTHQKAYREWQARRSEG